MSWLWNGLRAVLSLGLLVVAAVMFWGHVRLGSGAAGTGPLGVAAAALFLAALPWVRVEPGHRALALTGVVLALALIIFSVHGAAGGRTYPRDCAFKRSWCLLENLLHAVGGPVLVAAPYFIAGLLLLGFSVRALWRGHRRSRG